MSTSTEVANPAIKHLFLDLEDTVITPIVEGWADTELINQDKVRAFLAEFQPDFVHIFSFAIWNEQDLSSFEWSIKPRLEKAYGFSISSAPMLDSEITKACCNSKWIHPERVTRQDVIDFWGKQDGFRLFVKNKFPMLSRAAIEVVLLDDMVFHEEFSFPDHRLKGRILNIDEL